MSFWKVSIQQANKIEPIENADNIELATVLGWKCVVKKSDNFKIGDIGIYIPIDSHVPDYDPRFDFMKFTGYKVKTIKLRGQISQGLFLPMSFLTEKERYTLDNEWKKEDISELLDIWHYHPEPDYTPTGILYPFPSFIKKTDQERVQNIPEVLKINSTSYEITEKLDGMSLTMYWNNGKFGICTHNKELERNKNSEYWQIAKKLCIEDKLKELSENIAIQGELIGERIQKNKYKLNKKEWKIFSIWDIDKQCYLNPIEARDLTILCLLLDYVPIIDHAYDFMSYDSVDSLLKLSSGKSQLNPNIEREGVVFKSNEAICDQIVSFKVINNKYLLKE